VWNHGVVLCAFVNVDKRRVSKAWRVEDNRHVSDLPEPLLDSSVILPCDRFVIYIVDGPEHDELPEIP
jgi:hypothetical protein